MSEPTPVLPVNPSPKARFLTVGSFIKEHKALFDMPPTQRAIDFGLLEYQRQLCEQNSDANAAAGNHFKLKGALEFIHVMKHLSEMPQKLSPLPITNLDHNH